MTIALQEAPVSIAEPPPRRIDLLRPTFYALAAVLTVLVIVPLAWLGYYSVIDKAGQLTIANFAALVGDATLRKPFAIALGMALAVGVVSCAVATPLAWLVARTDLPGRRVVRAFVIASFVTPPFLGAIAWEILAAPNSGLINVAWRQLTAADQGDALVNIYTFAGLVFAIAC